MKKSSLSEQHLSKVCPKELVSDHAQVIDRILSSLHLKKLTWEEPLKVSMARACFLEFPAWKTRIVFQLALYGKKNNLKTETLGELTEILTVKSLGKREYVETGRIWEHMSSSGLDREEISRYFSKALPAKVRPANQFAQIYVSFRKTALSENQAFNKTLSLMKSKYWYGTAKQKEKIFADSGLQIPFPAESKIIWDHLKQIRNNQAPIKVKVNGGQWNLKQLRASVQKWLGTPYKSGGKTSKGIDCSSFVRMVIFDQFPNTQLSRSSSHLKSSGNKVNFNELEPGDLVFFSDMPKENRITHVGIFINNGNFAHASSSRGVTISSLDKKYYKDRFVLARRIIHD